MTDFEERSGAIEVPKATGIDGLLLTIKEILQQHDYVQNIKIDSNGLIAFKYFAMGDSEKRQFEVDFKFLQPDAIIRNATVREIIIPEDACASTVVGVLFETANRERMYPIAFVSGTDSTFWEWHWETTGIQLQSREVLYGIPFLTDRHIPDSVLMLCTSYGKGSALVDTQVSYKIVMGLALHLPSATVDILP